MIDAILPAGASATAGPRSIAGADLAGTRGVAPAANAETGVDFGAMLAQMTSDAAGVVRNAETTSVAGIQGRASVQQVVEAVMGAEQTLQGAVAIRDKVVAAYLEISRMQI
jgi:flagellar hook-basal body complex protein FliE